MSKHLTRFRWDHPAEWLDHYLDNISDPGMLRHEARELASRLSGDDIQDLYQYEMDTDGYFTPLKTPR